MQIPQFKEEITVTVCKYVEIDVIVGCDQSL